MNRLLFAVTANGKTTATFLYGTDETQVAALPVTEAASELQAAIAAHLGLDGIAGFQVFGEASGAGGKLEALCLDGVPMLFEPEGALAEQRDALRAEIEAAIG